MMGQCPRAHFIIYQARGTENEGTAVEDWEHHHSWEQTGALESVRRYTLNWVLNQSHNKKLGQAVSERTSET